MHESGGGDSVVRRADRSAALTSARPLSPPLRPAVRSGVEGQPLPTTDIDARSVPDVVGPIPKRVFLTVHRAFAFRKWLDIIGESDATLNAVLLPLETKAAAWTMRDYHRVYGILEARRAASASLTESKAPASVNAAVKKPGSGTPLAVPEALARQIETLEQRLQTLSARLLALRSISNADRRVGHSIAHLQSLLFKVSRDLGQLRSLAAMQPGAMPDVMRRATSASPMTVQLMQRLAYVETLIGRVAKAPSRSTVAAPRSLAMFGQARGLLLQMSKYGLPIAGGLVPLRAISKTLDQRVSDVL